MIPSDLSERGRLMEGGSEAGYGGPESSSGWGGDSGQEQQLDGGGAYDDWVGDGDSAANYSSAEATRSTHHGHQDRNDDAGVDGNTKDNQARRYV